MKASAYLAFDLGAESGRAILGWLEGKRLRLQDVHRFPTSSVRLGDHLFWDVLRLWSEVKHGLGLAASLAGDSLRSLGIDTWGVDFGLLAADDTLIGNPYHYRDQRTAGMLERAFALLPKAEIYAQTGIQLMQINSLYQLLAMAQAGHPALSIARTFLNMPDLFDFFLTGRRASEFTIATTTQCYNPREGTWAWDVLEALGIPTHLFGEIVQPGTILGSLRPSLADELGLSRLAVVASAGHDTASAVAAAPADASDSVYLSSGTWSLMGVELDKPLISPESLAANMTNEGGVAGKTRFLKNIAGLWLVQECRRKWAQAGKIDDYDELVRMAAASPAFVSFVDPGDPRFLSPEDMPAAIQSYCRETGQSLPSGKGALVRCALESLALEYRRVLATIEGLTAKTYPVIHIIGGGSQNRLLNQLTADAAGRTVVAGPVEATAIGNLLVQAIGMGEIGSLAEARAIVRDSFQVETYEPKDVAAWDEACERYEKLKIR